MLSVRLLVVSTAPADLVLGGQILLAVRNFPDISGHIYVLYTLIFP